jgi:hypothetical protein
MNDPAESRWLNRVTEKTKPELKREDDAGTMDNTHPALHSEIDGIKDTSYYVASRASSQHPIVLLQLTPLLLATSNPTFSIDNHRVSVLSTLRRYCVVDLLFTACDRHLIKPLVSKIERRKHRVCSDKEV